jgi:hypothetical protein
MSPATELVIMKAMYKHNTRAMIQFMWLIVLLSGILITQPFLVIFRLILERGYSMILLISGSMASNCMAISEKKKNFKISCRGLIMVLLQHLLGVAEENRRKASSSIAAVPAEIRTEYLPNACLEH